MIIFLQKNLHKNITAIKKNPLDPFVVIKIIYYDHEKKSYSSSNPTKMFIKVLIWCFFGALVLILLTNFVQNSIIRRCFFCIIFLNIDAKSACTNFVANLYQIASNLMQILHHCRQLMQIRCQKASCTNV